MLLNIFGKFNFLFYFIKFIFENKTFSIFTPISFKKVGNGLSNTLLLTNGYILKIRNKTREDTNLYKYQHDFKKYYSLKTNDKFSYEYQILNTLSKLSLAPSPVEVGSDFLLINYISDSMTLGDYLEKNSYYDFKIVFDGIDKMHGCGIFHMDLNLGNILVSSDGIKIFFIDFEIEPNHDLSMYEKKCIDYFILIEKLKRFYPQIYAKYANVIFVHINQRINILESVILYPEIINMELLDDIKKNI